MKSFSKFILMVSLSIGILTGKSDFALAGGYEFPADGYKGPTSIWGLGLGLAKSTQVDGVGVGIKISFRKIYEDGKSLCLTEHDWLWNTQVKAEGNLVDLSGNGDWAAPNVDLRIVPVAYSRVNCYNDEPIENENMTFQILPIRVSRALGLNERIGVAFSLIGADFSTNTNGKTLWNKDDQTPVIQILSRAAVQFFGIARADLEDRFDFNGLQFFSALVEERLTAAISVHCSLDTAVRASVDVKGGTNGIFREYNLGLSSDYMCATEKNLTKRKARHKDQKSNLTTGYYFNLDRTTRYDDENPGHAEIKLMGGYQARF